MLYVGRSDISESVTTEAPTDGDGTRLKEPPTKEGVYIYIVSGRKPRNETMSPVPEMGEIFGSWRYFFLVGVE